jgi:hypothetical protein
MSVAADYFGDPLHARASTLQVAYYDPDGIWPLIEQGFYGHMPLPRIEWSVPSTGKGYILPPMICTMTPHDDESFVFAQIPVNLYRMPFVHILLVRCESSDEFRRRVRDSVRAWTEDMESRGNEWLVVYAPIGTRQGTLGALGNAVSTALSELTKHKVQVVAGTTLASRTYRKVFESLRFECAPRRQHASTTGASGDVPGRGLGRAVASRFLRIDEAEVLRRERASQARLKRQRAATDVPASPAPSDASSGGGVAKRGAMTPPAAPAFKVSLTAGRGAASGPALRFSGGGGSGPAGGDASSDGAADPEEHLAPLTAAETVELRSQWSALVSRLHACVMTALTARVAAYEAAAAKLFAQREVPGWNFCQYFCIRESLAFVYSQVLLCLNSRASRSEALFTWAPLLCHLYYTPFLPLPCPMLSSLSDPPSARGAGLL